MASLVLPPKAHAFLDHVQKEIRAVEVLQVVTERAKGCLVTAERCRVVAFFAVEIRHGTQCREEVHMRSRTILVGAAQLNLEV